MTELPAILIAAVVGGIVARFLPFKVKCVRAERFEVVTQSGDILGLFAVRQRPWMADEEWQPSAQLILKGPERPGFQRRDALELEVIEDDASIAAPGRLFLACDSAIVQVPAERASEALALSAFDYERSESVGYVTLAAKRTP